MGSFYESDTTKQQYLMSRLNDLKSRRSFWNSRWQEVSTYVSPYSGCFNVNDHLQSRSFDAILNNVAGSALNSLVSGLASAVTSSSRQWFKVVPEGFASTTDIEVAKWCKDVEEILQRTFQKSNTYNSLHVLYQELCLFGVAVDLIYDNEDRVLEHHVLTAGQYYLQCNFSGEVDTLYREFQLTVAEAVRHFGYDKLPKSVQENFKTGKLDEYVTFCHAIEPRAVRDREATDNKNMPYASYYFMVDDSTIPIISESGFKFFPALCPRWNVLSNEVYGVSPAMIAMGNIKQLQVETKVKLEVLEMLSKPPLQAPSTASQSPIMLDPGAINFTSATGAEQQIRPIVTGLGDISALTMDIQQVSEDIKRDFYVDLFLLIQNQQDDRKTAAEIYALKEEKMLILGPVMERLQHELLEPLLTITYNKLVERNMIPPPPESIAGRPIELEFQSLLAQSQRALDINAIDRFISAIQTMSASTPEVLDRIDADGLFDVYRDRLAADPKIARSKAEADTIRQQRAQAQQQAIEAEQAQSMGNTVNQFAQAQRAGAEASRATQQLDGVGIGGLF